jgi:hypothetical protein
VILVSIWSFSTDFHNTHQHQISDICPVGAVLVYEDRQIEMVMLLGYIHDYGDMPKNSI